MDTVLPRNRHSRVEQRRQSMPVLFHEGLDVLLPETIESHEADDHIFRELRLEVFETAQLADAGVAIGRAEAQDRHFPGKLLRTHGSARQVGEQESWGRCRSPLRDEEQGRILPAAERNAREDQTRGQECGTSQQGSPSRVESARHWAPCQPEGRRASQRRHRGGRLSMNEAPATAPPIDLISCPSVIFSTSWTVPILCPSPAHSGSF